MPERPHPHDPAYRGTVYENLMVERYRYAAPYSCGKDVLDAACGTCWGWLQLGGARSLTGVDYSPEAVAEARKLGFADRIACAEMHRLPFPAGSFDTVLCLDAIEHVTVTAAREFLEECRRVLRKDGVLVLSTPLRKDGKHSTNPFHFMEYSREELLSLLETQFTVIDAKSSDLEDEAGLPVFLCAARLNAEPVLGRIHWTNPGFHERAAEALGFSLADQRFTILEATAQVLLAEGLGIELSARDAILRSIIAAQDPETGLFIEPLAASVPQTGSQHDEQYLHGMMTYFALHALDALGEKPKYRLHFLEAFSTKSAAREWLERLDWSNPWRESNRIMHLLSAFLFSLIWDGETSAADRYHDVLDWLEEHQDPRTGLWGTQQGAPLLNAAAGAYHFVPYFRYARRPVRCWSKIIGDCLELQNEEGLFAPSPGGGACEDMDVIDLLCNAVRATGDLHREVRQALTRAFWAIWNMQLLGGSFPYARRGDDSVYRFSSWPAMEARTGDGDLWATWFRLSALHTIRALLGEDLPPIGRWTFRRFPALGFHLQDTAIPPDAPPEHRPIWFRPLPAPPEPAEPRVSVVVTCYNLGQYLYESLSSVCRQTLQEIETVIVDDGSTDPYTIARLDDLAEAGWRVLRTENRGLPAARNLGIQNTRAPLICCLDADDRLRPDYLRKAAAALESNPRAGFVSCFYELFDEASGACRYARPQLPRMLARNEAVVSSVFRRQAWAETGGYCESLPAMQDWDFWISILEKGWEAEQLTEPLFDYRIRAGSMYSGTKKPHRYSRILSLIHARHFDLYQKHLAEVLRLQARFFAENVEFASRQEASWSRALRQLRREANRRALAAPAAAPATESASPERGQPAGQPAPAQAEPPPPDASGEPAPPPAPEAAASASVHPPSWIRTILWAIPQVLHPRAGWRGARNLVFYLRLLRTRRARALWDSLFDPLAYAAARPDVAHARIRPDIHYALAGAWEDADPSSAFSTAFYLKRHADVAERGINPLLHYALFGSAEGRIFASQCASFAEAPAFSSEIRQSGGPPCEPLVSVVIPCFNYGRYLEEALHSVLRQTFSNLEILVVEGGSTDSATAALVRRLERANLPRVRFFYRDAPCLAGDNRNYGIARAKGRYVCCLDADDQLDPVYLEAAVFFAELGDYDFVYPSLQSFGEDALEWLVDDPRWPGILRENQVTTVALFRRTIWETVGGYRDWGKGSTHLPEDWDFWIRAVGAGFRGAAMRARMMRYRVQSSSLSRHRTASYRDWSRRLAQENRSLAALERPPARPLPEVPRVSWTSLEDPSAQPAVLMALPFFTEGGAEKIFLALARRWRAQGTRVVVVTTLELSPASPDRLDVLRRVTPYVFDLPRILWNRDELRADFLYYLLRRHHVSLIYFAGCDLMYQLLPQIRQEFPQIAAVDQLFNDEVHFHTNRATARWIDCTIVPGERIARRLREEFGELEERVAVIPHGVRLPEGGAPASPALPPGFGNRPLVGFFGRLSPEKAPLDFIRIAAAVHEKAPETRFIMTGEGPEQDAVEKEIRRRRLSRVVFTPGFVPDVRPWIAACDVAVVPSRLDGMPLILFEAQSFGRCVVASRVGSIPEVIVHGETGLLCQPGDIDGFAAAILRLLESPETRRRIGEAARQRVFEEYSEQVMLDRYFRLFDSLLARRRQDRSS